MQEVDVELGRLKEKLARQEETLSDYLQAEGIDQSILRQQLLWQLSWQRCLAKYVTPENLQRYFERHRRDFDGTSMRVAQVLLQSQKEAAEYATTDLSSVVARAQQIRQEIVTGKISFAEAARRYSQSPSGPSGGELGWISHDGPMPPSFTDAAFQLQVGEISRPLTTGYGVHLIKCLEIKPGDKSWQEARDQLIRAVSKYLFRWLVDRPHPQEAIQYMEGIPHFRPGTRDLAQPSGAKHDPASTDSARSRK